MIVEERYDLGKLVTFIPNKKIPIHNWFYFKEGEKIIGITTAATLWAVAAIALACGYGRLDLGISVAILSYVTLKLRPLESRIRGEKKS